MSFLVWRIVWNWKHTHTHTTSRVSFKKKLREDRKKGWSSSGSGASIRNRAAAASRKWLFFFYFFSLLPCWLLLLLPGVVTHTRHTHTQRLYSRNVKRLSGTRHYKKRPAAAAATNTHNDR